MKLINLNIWGGKMFEPLMEFIKNESRDTDFFVLQEVFDTPTNETRIGDTEADMLKVLTLALPDFVPYFSPTQDIKMTRGGSTIIASSGEAIFVRRPYNVAGSGTIFVHRTRNANDFTAAHNEPAAVQFVTIMVDASTLTIYNFHGFVPDKSVFQNYPDSTDPKIDTPDRLDQARRIRAILDANPGAKILSGDFNLRADTESMKITKGEDLQNLCETFAITDTRGPLHDKPVRVVDHMLVSPEIDVKDFQVPTVAISDHLPLILTFDLAEENH